MSPEVAQRDSTAATTSDSVRPATFPCSSAEATAAFSAAGLPGSDRARRSPCSLSSRPTTANSSLPSLVATVALVMCSASSCSARPANDALLAPRTLITSTVVRRIFDPNGLGNCPRTGYPSHWPATSSSSRNLSTIRLCRASSVSDSPTIRLASSVARVPTSARSEVSAC
jgi:hypothetical protein